jgi:hypothetical protein
MKRKSIVSLQTQACDLVAATHLSDRALLNSPSTQARGDGAPKSAVHDGSRRKTRGRLSARHMRSSSEALAHSQLRSGSSGKRMLICGDLSVSRAPLSPEV